MAHTHKEKEHTGEQHIGCNCGAEHSHIHHEHEKEDNALEHVNPHTEQWVYIIDNLGCANCAAKMEKRINELPQVEAASITFATKQLRVASDCQEKLLPILQEICSSIEPETIVRLKEGHKDMEEKTSEQKRDIVGILTGALLFAAGIFLQDKLEIISIVSFVTAYLILGGRIIGKALQNLTKGHLFDENFLMGFATLAAFAIGDFPEAVGIMLFYRIGACFEEIAVAKSRQKIMEAADLRPEVVQIVLDDSVTEIPAKEAKIGDILLIRAGDRIPLDAVVVEGESRIDTAPVTGEPVPVRVQPGDRVISGCVNTSGVLRIQVEKELEDSMVTRILNSVENAAASKPKIDRFITRFARVYTPVVVSMAAATALIPSLITGEWSKWIYTAITFLVISCPCALVLSVPLAFFSGIGAGSRRGILFKGGAALEALNKVKTVVMDKTGTITKGDFRVQKCVSIGDMPEEQLLSLAASCEKHSTHPIANSILMAAREWQTEVVEPEMLEEISGKGMKAQTQAGTVLCGNRSLLEAYQVEVDKNYDLCKGTEVLMAVNGKFVGYIVIEDTLKEEARDAIGRLKRKGLKTVMLTGDDERTASEIAKQTGIEQVYAKLLPEDKLEKLWKIRQQNGEVMFVGDGINDAPVLAGADVGAAMGSGADAAIEAADVVFMTSSVQAIPESVTIAKQTNRIAIQNVVFALAVKVLVMVLGLFGVANMWLAVFADTGVAMLCVLNSVRILYKK